MEATNLKPIIQNLQQPSTFVVGVNLKDPRKKGGSYGQSQILLEVEHFLRKILAAPRKDCW
ncbi:hypothetical protein FACHB389_15635 [Nostoc calcicola FACHB-389]|nr:hypothetical protein FACHB389_15635 [Nostoc calcicola FACHB-389]